jgi:hypothetical protein
LHRKGQSAKVNEKNCGNKENSPGKIPIRAINRGIGAGMGAKGAFVQKQAFRHTTFTSGLGIF